MYIQFTKKTAHQWHLQTNELYEGRPTVLNWLVFLPEKLGTKHQRAYLLKSAKDLLLAMIKNSVGKTRSSLCPGTVLGWWRKLGALTRWMNEKNIWTYAQLRSHDFKSFIESRRPRKNTGSHITANTAMQYVMLLRCMWELRSKYIAPLSFNPDIADHVAVDVKLLDLTPFSSVPEESAIPLLADAFEWIETYGTFLVRMAEKLWSDRTKMVGLTAYAKTKALRKCFVDISGDEVYPTLAKKLDMTESKVANVVARALTMTEGAVIIIILLMVGMRAQELIRLDIGCVRIDGDNGDEFSYIDGIGAKFNGRARSWVAGRPLPGIIGFVERLFALPRSASGCMALFIGRNGLSMHISGRKIQRMAVKCLSTKMVAFAQASFRNDRPKIDHIHPHMARKTFAKFVVLRDKNALEALSLHFGHAYKYFTDGAYIGADFQLAQLLAEEDRKELSRSLEDMLTSTWSAGKARAKIADDVIAAVDGKFKGRVTLRAKVDALIKRGVQLGPCDWGYCVYSEPLSACGGDATGPNPVQRAPDTCANCANLLITEKYVFWWNQRLAREEKFLMRSNLPQQTRLVVEKRVAVTRKLLATAVTASSPI